VNPNDLAPDEQPLLDLAIAIADGANIDWSRISDSTLSGASATAQSLARKLQQLDRVARGHDVLRSHVQPPAAAAADETLLTRSRREAAGLLDKTLQVVWGPLIVLDKLGRGSFGDVYRAWDPRLEREVALKLLRESTAATTTVVHEGRLLARVRHPNVITVYGAEQVADRVGIWMEYVRGNTLADDVRNRGPLSPTEAAKVGVEVCQALAAVHAAGLLHRDVKAQNVLRDSAGRIVLGDFGTGVSIHAQEETDSEQLAGTPLYLAPELFEGQPPSERSDLYSLGVLLYFLVSGTYPVQGKSVPEIRRAHRAGGRTPLSAVRSDLPASFAKLIDALLESGPDTRYGSAASAETALVGWLQEAQRSSEPGNRDRPRAHSHWARWAMLAAASFAAIAIPTAWSVMTRNRAFDVAPTQHIPLAGASTIRHIANAPCSGAPSADGASIACVESVAHALRRRQPLPPPLVLFHVLSGEMRVLRTPSGGERITGATIAPDGRQVAFVSASADGALSVGIVDVATGTTSLLQAVSDGIRAVALGIWSSYDDRIEARVVRADNAQRFALISPATGLVEEVFAFPSAPQGFSRSPDGSRIAFDVRQANTRAERDILMCDLPGGRCTTIAPHAGHDFSPAFTPAGTVVFNSDRDGTLGLWSVAVDGQNTPAAPQLLRDTGRTRVNPLGFTADGALFYDLWINGFDIQAAEFDRAAVGPSVRLSRRPVDYNRSPVWSRDGQLLAYVSQRGPFAEPGGVALVVQTVATGSEREFRFDFAFNMTRLAFSPDALTLAVRGLRRNLQGNGNFGVHLVDVRTGNIRQTLTRRDPLERFVEDQIGDIDWLADGTLIFSSAGGVRAFASDGREFTIWSAPAGEVVQGLALSFDGSSVAVTLSARNTSRVLIVPIDRRAGARELRVGTAGVLAESWTPDGRAVLVTTPSNQPEMRELALAPVDSEALATVGLIQPGLSQVRVHPDGSRIAYTSGAPHPELWVMSGANQ
jgi:Tol biopolymer transport system component